ncbi:phage portal protein [Actinomadura sp. NEAU-AAG7]|uniref:phage portal protein n=1 Tax=Actinomadura sp. NEAU-AAG7 TaxID=2839640 RepID=UPI001BE4CCFB|nr:phage portal protein [Actinomadura sp. NEAU-AAG7]MBT2213466.1 phage portal protein [Actinomadura sp. NEAU-AAG7]
MNLLRRALDRRPARSISTLDDYAAALEAFTFNGNTYPVGVPQQTLTGQTERIAHSLTGYATHAFGANSAVFACMATRMLVFAAARFQYQRFSQGRPSELFGDATLRLLEVPWPGGTTQDLLARMIQDADLCGNSYWTVSDGELIRLRPDWVGIVLEPRRIYGGQVGYRRVGYTYTEHGPGSGANPALFRVGEVAHFAPLPDPLATYRGMSWLTPVIRDVANDEAMGRHKSKFFENGATPNMIVSFKETVTKEQFRDFIEATEEAHRGVNNAYKTLYLGGGADVEVVGNSFEQMSFTAVQGHGETRIAAAAGVPPIIVGLSEGLQAATYSNYAQARRRFADGTCHPLWGNAAGSLAPLLPVPPGARLFYDARDVPFLREDRRDAADIAAVKAQTIRTYIDAGFDADAAIRATESEDLSLLSGAHSGLFSVQLQPPVTATEDDQAPPDDAPDDAPADAPADDTESGE